MTNTFNAYYLQLQQEVGAKRLTKLKREIEAIKEELAFTGFIVEPIGVKEAEELVAKLRELLEMEIELGLTKRESKHQLSIKYSYWR